MRSEPSVTTEDHRLAILDGLIYGDIFDCAVTLTELRRYARLPIGGEALRRRLREDGSLKQIVLERDGFYCFADRPSLIAQRPQKIRRARRLQRRARVVARALRALPFVRGVVLTGSVAADHAADDADVDLMLTVARTRLGTVFLMLGLASRALGRRVFCPNYYICESSPARSPASLYIARELAQARVLVGDGSFLQKSRSWLVDVFPNAAWAPVPSGIQAEGESLQRLLEIPLNGALGERLEQVGRRVALRRLDLHHRRRGEDVPDEVLEKFAAGHSLRFHAGAAEHLTLERYAFRRQQIATYLQALDADRPLAHGVRN
jgi:hypothetical protein